MAVFEQSLQEIHGMVLDAPVGVVATMFEFLDHAVFHIETYYGNESFVLTEERAIAILKTQALLFGLQITEKVSDDKHTAYYLEKKFHVPYFVIHQQES